MTENDSQSENKSLNEETEATVLVSDAVDEGNSIPHAEVVGERHWSRWVAWMVPVIVAVVVGALMLEYKQQSGLMIEITFSNGYGIREGDAIRCKGIKVGRVEHVALEGDVQSVVMKARLNADSAHLAKRGARFWIARAQVSLQGISGLETIAGPRYIALLPREGVEDVQLQFAGLDSRPVLATEPPGGLEITLYAMKRGSLRAGAPVLYRQTRIGTIVNVGLASDATTVEALAYIRPGYTTIIRDNTRFWNASGADFKASFTEGFSFQLESIQTLLDGGVGVATPTQQGGLVTTGHRFELKSRSEDEWLTWQPAIPLGSAWLPEGIFPPTPKFASVTRRQKGFFKSTKSKHGWVLGVEGGIVGPIEMLTPNENAEAPVSVLEVAGKQILLNQEVVSRGMQIGMLKVKIEGIAVWPKERIRIASEPEDCLVFTGGGNTPRALASVHLRGSEKGRWSIIDNRISFDDSMAGGCVVARKDGKLIGLLRVTDGFAVVDLFK